MVQEHIMQPSIFTPTISQTCVAASRHTTASLAPLGMPCSRQYEYAIVRLTTPV